jgi:hypothetical protein
MAINKAKVARIFLYIIVALLLLAAVITIVFNTCYKGYVVRHMDGWVYKATDSTYHATIQDVHINLFTDKIIVSGIRIWPDSISANFKKKIKQNFKISVALTVNELELDDLQLLKLLQHKIVMFGDVYIRQPKVLIESKPAQPDSTATHNGKQPSIKGLTAGDIHIIKPDITFKSFGIDGDNFSCKLSGGDADLSDWRLDVSQTDTTRFLLAKSCIINGAAFYFYKPSTMYEFKTSSFSCNTEQEHLEIKGLSIEPPMGNDKFYSILGHRTTICRLHAPMVTLKGFDWIGLMHRNTVNLSMATFNDADLSLYFSYVIPSHPGNMLELDPHMLLHNAALKINVANVYINKSRIKYTEREEASKKEETIPFKEVTAHATNITNIKSALVRNPWMEIKAHGIIFKKGALKASLKILESDTLGHFVLDGDLANVDAADIREQASVMADVEVDSLHIQKIKVHVSGNRDSARSALEVVYHNFKMKLLREKNDKKLVKMPVLSFIAKEIFVYSDNPMPGKELRVTTTSTQRNVTWPYFGTIVKNVRVGARHTLTDHPKVVDAIVKANKAKNGVVKFIKGVFKMRKKK